MEKIVYRFALLIAIVVIVMNVVAPSVTLTTSLLRGVIVFFGVLFIFFIAGQLMKVLVSAMETKPEKSRALTETKNEK
jgi:hypothetical protein